MAEPRPEARRLTVARRALALTLACGLAGLLDGCASTLQDQPVGNVALERLLEVQRYPIYWVGASFHGLKLTSALPDIGGAYTVQYGNCYVGGQEACLTPLELISTPESPFIPGIDTHDTETTTVRGVKAVIAERGEVVELKTSNAVIDIRARRRSIALAAAQAMVPINQLGEPGAPLPAALQTGEESEKALSSQRTHPLKLLPPIPSE
ncbi:MAG TPA: hypothetical protein VGF95_05065 [Solirubrobacteraceae bacterium]